MYLLNCSFGLNKNDDFDNYESTIIGEPYLWRNQDDHWDVTLDFNSCGTASSIVHIFVLFILFESLPEPLMIDGDLCYKK